MEPDFFQSWWFRILCGIAAFVVLWLIYLLRLRQMTLRLRARLEERYEERERIARELHDTLLQGVQGLILRFQAVAERIGDPQTRQLMDQVLDRADAVLVEGRDRVRELRELAKPVTDLGKALGAVGRELAEIRETAFRVQQHRAARPLHPLVRDELYQIGREALFNAFQHSDARTVEVEVAYAREALRLRIRDDGKGIDAAVLEAGGRPGHWGLAGMRERTRRLGGQFEIHSRPGAGTLIELHVPASIAYCDRRFKAWLAELAGKAVASDVFP